ncbi:hypothetical protein HLI17_11720 [Rhizobium laguerreae]|uniref:Endonuclease/exonuclease/phosphatase domain-containing protein n=1 Tax=Rhizobium laguerreae TaxID=1076926 RepID=A0A7Y2R422_9HYPH|nr:hypothetical protein [Rhizobium laguerreae]
MKLATYNVNEVNGRLEVLPRWLDEARPDVVCLQELKATQKSLRSKRSAQPPASACFGRPRRPRTASPSVPWGRSRISLLERGCPASRRTSAASTLKLGHNQSSRISFNIITVEWEVATVSADMENDPARGRVECFQVVDCILHRRERLFLGERLISDECDRGCALAIYSQGLSGAEVLAHLACSIWRQSRFGRGAGAICCGYWPLS